MPRLRRKEAERRQHRRRLVFAVGEGSTSSIFPDRPTVWILLNNGTWLDISGDVRFEAGIKCRRGRSATDTRVRAGSASMQINNLDGKYSPRNPTSVLYGLIGRGTQIYITRYGTRRFWGEIPEWPSEWTTGGQDAWVNLVAAGPLRRLLAPNAPLLQSALTRSAIAANPVALWTLEEGLGATEAIAYNTSQASLLPTGDVIFGGTTDLAGATESIKFNTVEAYISGSVPNIGTPWGVEFASKGDVSVVNAIFSTTDSNGNTYQLLPSYAAFGFPMQVCIAPANNGAVTFLNLTQPWTTDAEFTDTWHYYGMYFQQSGGAGTNIQVQAYIDGVKQLDSNVPFTPGITLATPVTLQAPSVIPGTGSPLDGTLHSLSHVQFFSSITQSSAYKALTGYTGEASGRRIERLLQENSVGFVGTGDLDDTMPMGPQGPDRLADLIFDCEAADNGFLGEDRNSFALTYRTLASMLNTSATLQLNYSASGNLVLPLKPSDNDQRIVNDSDVRLASGTGHFRYALTSGPMSTARPENGGIGPYPENPPINVETVADAGDVAGIRVGIGTIDKQRFDQVNVNVANTVTNHGLISLGGEMMGVDIGHRISIDNPPVWTTVDQLNFIMVGEYEEFDQIRCTIAYDTVLQDSYLIGILDDPTLGRLESDGVTILVGIDSVTTTFKGQTATGELCATTALLPDDFPFDVMVTGERLTVTDITGVTNPQDWTVIRSINGVVKPLPTGSPIYARNPFRLSP